MTKSHHYWKSIAAFKKDLRETIPQDELKELHRREPVRHLLCAARQFDTPRGNASDVSPPGCRQPGQRHDAGVHRHEPAVERGTSGDPQPHRT